MSHHSRPQPRPRAAAVAAILFLVPMLACASAGGGAAPPAATGVPDRLAVNEGGGKTLENLFAGRFPGVTVSQTSGGGLQIRLRGGPTSFVGGTEPLYVVDETPMPQNTGGIMLLSPYDIERIEVLKNPADVALYGVRGANGVIKITTRRPGVH